MDKENQIAKKPIVRPKKPRSKNDRKDIAMDQGILLVNNTKECQAAVKQLRLDCNEYSVLGINCDSVKFNRQKISLLILASKRDFCALIRLHSLKKIPVELRELLEDKDILKIGVNPFEVALKLCDYDVRTESIFDLRYLAEMCNNRSAPLHMLSAEYLKVKLNDDFRLDQKHWKKEKSLLKMQDINYAAKVGRATIGLFEKFKEKLMCDKPQTNDLQAFIDANVKPSLNKIYRYQKKNADENQIYKAPYDPIKCNDVRVISDIDSCRAIVQQLREHCKESKVLGFGCKLTIRQTVTLLQLVSYRGLCALIRLSKLKSMPNELQEFLEDKSILKIGVKISSDVEQLKADYDISVANTIDLRHLAKLCKYSASNLGDLTKTHLNTDIDSIDWRLKITDWKLDSFTRENVNYAAKTVHVVIELFKIFEEKLLEEKCSGDREQFIELCSSYLNDDYPKRKSNSANGNRENIQYGKLPDARCIRVASTIEECGAVVEELRRDCNEYNVCGFDCEWVPIGRQKVALLQLATHSGLCALIRLCKLEKIPEVLQKLLADNNILKVGVMPHKDANKLQNDYRLKVLSTLDLVQLARKCKFKSDGLGSMSKEVLVVELEHKKRGKITNRLHRKWADETLDVENIKYAASDALVAIELFKRFQEILIPNCTSDKHTEYVQQFIEEHCKRLLKNK